MFVPYTRLSHFESTARRKTIELSLAVRRQVVEKKKNIFASHQFDRCPRFMIMLRGDNLSRGGRACSELPRPRG